MPSSDLAGRSILVTGSSSGIGRAAVEAFVDRGATVILANRSEEKTRPLIAALHRRPGVTVRFVPLDLADLAQVQRSAAQILDAGWPIDVLVNNAGLAGVRALSRDGFELTFATNHLGPFLFTERLLPRLRESSQGRVVNVSSAANLGVREMDWTLATRPATGMADSMSRYNFSKLLNVLHAKELARRLADTAVTTSSLHPGAVATDVWRQLPRPVQWLIKPFMRSEEKGAETTVYCATAPELATVSGRYYVNAREAQPNPLAEDPAVAAEAWARSEAWIAEKLPRA